MPGPSGGAVVLPNPLVLIRRWDGGKGRKGLGIRKDGKEVGIKKEWKEVKRNGKEVQSEWKVEGEKDGREKRGEGKRKGRERGGKERKREEFLFAPPL